MTMTYWDYTLAEKYCLLVFEENYEDYKISERLNKYFESKGFDLHDIVDGSLSEGSLR